MSIFKGSRYIHTPIYARRGENFILNIRDKAKFNPENFTYYTVVQGDTIDGIAFKFFGNANLYWAIMDSNPSLMSELDIEVGDVLAIPSFEEVVKVSE